MMKKLIFSALLSLMILPQIALADTDIFFNKYMVASVIILAIGASSAILAGGRYAWVAFISVVAILSLMLSIIGVYPKWVIIVAIIGAGAVFGAFVLRGMK
jgi:hypothetical protein